MTSSERQGTYFPRDTDTLEFLSLEAAQGIVDLAMADRTDDANQLLPLQEGHSVQNSLHTGFTRRREQVLSDSEAADLEAGRNELIAELQSDDRYTAAVDTSQGRDSVRLTNTKEIHLDGVLKHPLRVYVAGGWRALQIAAEAVGAGADFAAAKIWAAKPTTHEQPMSSDAPIFTVRSLKQLRSTVQALRNVLSQDMIEGEPFVGLTVADSPGIMVAQGDTSFHNKMSIFFEAAVTEAANDPDLALSAGQEVTDAWKTEVAVRMRSLALQHAVEYDVSPVHHALAPEQDITPILKAIR
jgi:hypothetical protein